MIAQNSDPNNLVEPRALGSWLAKYGDIWQMNLLKVSDLCSFAHKRGVQFRNDHIARFWELGLLRADLVVSDRKLKQIGLISVGRNRREQWLYADERPVSQLAKEWKKSLSKVERRTDTLEPLFHPFRFYVLYHLRRALRSQFSPVTDGFFRSTGQWNDITSLAVATEPCFYEQLFGEIRYKNGIEEETQDRLMAEHWSKLEKVYQQAGLDTLEDVRRHLCEDSDDLDENTDVHTLLRLANGNVRLNLTGHLGGAIHLRTMAEMLRRASEKVWGGLLPEEDELGFGMMPLDAKKDNYGSNRLFDDDWNVANEFMRFLGLDYGVRSRWYVEGDTEYGALRRLIELYSATWVQVINLKSHFIEKKTFAFLETLKNDIRAGIFSFVLLDNDNPDYVRMVRKAAKDDHIYGGFFIADPDFEFANFSLAELEGILWDIAIENGTDDSQLSVLRNAISAVQNADALWSDARRALPDLLESGKGEAWGKRLMEYAIGNPQKADGTSRPLMEAIITALQTGSVQYAWQREEFRVDPETGKLIKRAS